MHKVSGIGGFFFRAQDSDALTRWYRDSLGINPVPTAESEKSWRQEAGETAFTSMPGSVDQFGQPDRSWTINFRVPDLEGWSRRCARLAPTSRRMRTQRSSPG